MTRSDETPRHGPFASRPDDLACAYWKAMFAGKHLDVYFQRVGDGWGARLPSRGFVNGRTLDEAARNLWVSRFGDLPDDVNEW